MTDAELERKVRDELARVPKVDSSEVAVSVHHGTVTLRGTVHNTDQKIEARWSSQRVVGVVAVDDQLQVRPLHPRADNVLRGAVLQALMRDARVPSTVDATVKDGLVTLTGTAERQDERDAAELATNKVAGIFTIDNQVALVPPTRSAAHASRETVLMGGEDEVVEPHAGLLDWLASCGVDYELDEHPTTFTAVDTARAERVDAATVAKAVGVVADDGRKALMVLDANEHLDLRSARRLMGGSHVRLMTEMELRDTCPGCDVGAVPPVGRLFALPTYVATAIRDVDVLTFAAGSRRFAVRVDRREWERALRPIYAELAARPAGQSPS